MARALILSGGIFHDFPATSGVLAEQLCRLGAAVEVSEDLERGLARLKDFDLLVVNALRWRMLGEKYDPYRAAMAFSPSVEAREAVRRHLSRGRSLLAIHTAVICFDDWPEWGDVLGAQWEWAISGHPPLGLVDIEVAEPDHPLVEGIRDFKVEDEVYGHLAQRSGLHPILRSAHGGSDHPVLWARETLGGRVAVDLLGHGVASLQVPEHRLLVERLLRWCLR